jgi:hypothetical protein
MKILLVHPGASWSTADVFSGLAYGLRQIGADVTYFRLDDRIEYAQKWLHTMQRKKNKDRKAAGLEPFPKPTRADVMYHAGVGALEMALRHKVDVVLVVSAMLLHPDVVILMKRAGLRVTVLFTESPYDIEAELKMAALVDGCWTNERTCVPAFAAVNPRSGYLPHAWHPEKHFRSARAIGEIPSHDVVFVGSGFRERIAFFNAIDWTGIDLGLYGVWDGMGLKPELAKFIKGKEVSNEYAASLYRRAKVGLNLYRIYKRAHPHKKPEVVFHLSDYRSEVAEVFGDVVPTFTTATEAEALIRRWLPDDEGRANVAAQLPACVAEASWIARAKTVLGDLHLLLRQAEVAA